MTESEIIFNVQESPEGGYEARAPGHSICTQADTLDELRTMAQDAVRCHFGPDAGPRVIRLHLVRN
jgi:predicted RNase H-like HicB family nuclease